MLISNFKKVVFVAISIMLVQTLLAITIVYAKRPDLRQSDNYINVGSSKHAAVHLKLCRSNKTQAYCTNVAS